MKTLKLVFACLLMISFMLTSCQKEEIIIDTITPVETGTTESGKRMLQQFTPNLIVDYSAAAYDCCWTSHYVVDNPSVYMTTPNKSFKLYINGWVVASNTTGVFSKTFTSAGTHTYQVKVIDTTGSQPVSSQVKTGTHGECIIYC